ncbi:GNAT family N-acetyltransferase [Vibrio sp. EA2]|uniref:GNAT family N-acetyltransferase n=1 Tax=Vibrio sp. EA2 TaxID=3079860 RepID=UPI002949022E|nr:GNAT family N-acetyltransferase [Vibrio sp. EA2]MDV6251087.1 GNAT family N-acetyltransferase [Vibrio sp. EA2]
MEITAHGKDVLVSFVYDLLFSTHSFAYLAFRNPFIINLFYLKPEFRGQGLGSELQDFIFSQLKSAKCQYVQLRYLPANSQGVAFYRKHGWKDVGEMDTRGQLAQKRIPE